MAKKAVKEIKKVVEVVELEDADLASGPGGFIPKDDESICQDKILVEE